MKTPRRVFEEMVDCAIGNWAGFFDWQRDPNKRAQHVGELTKRLSPEDREVLKGLTSEDTLKYRPLFTKDK